MVIFAIGRSNVAFSGKVGLRRSGSMAVNMVDADRSPVLLYLCSFVAVVCSIGFFDHREIPGRIAWEQIGARKRKAGGDFSIRPARRW